MEISPGNYQNTASAKSDIAETSAVRQTEKKSESIQNVNSSPSQDTIEISGRAGKLSRAELREQAALARIQTLKQQNAAITQSDAQAESEGTLPEDPLTAFINAMFKMMEERQEIQLENAAEQAERQKEEMDAAMLELEEARAEKKAAQEETITTIESLVSPPAAASTKNIDEAGSKSGSGNPSPGSLSRKGEEQSVPTYGKKGGIIAFHALSHCSSGKFV